MDSNFSQSSQTADCQSCIDRHDPVLLLDLLHRHEMEINLNDTPDADREAIECLQNCGCLELVPAQQTTGNDGSTVQFHRFNRVEAGKCQELRKRLEHTIHSS